MPVLRKTVINLFGEPCAGKSTAAHYITAGLKMNGISAEYTGEYAKDCAWENKTTTVANQIYVFAKQYHRMWTLAQNKDVEIIITDSPLLLSLHYNQDKAMQGTLETLVTQCWNQFDNHCYWLSRSFAYKSEGRFQSCPEEAAHEGLGIMQVLGEHDIKIHPVESNKQALNAIVEEYTNLAYKGLCSK